LEINISLGFISYLASGLLYLFLLAIYFVGSQQERLSKPFIILLCATLIWSGLLTLSQIGASIAFEMVTIAELMRYFTWFYILHTAAGYYLRANAGFKFSNPLTPINVAGVFVLALITLATNDFWVSTLELRNPISLQIGWLLCFSVLGLLLVEQVIRNTPSTNRGTIVFLCISAGAIFAYDFFVFSNAMLVQSIDYEFWSARGIVNIVVVPTLVLAAVRNPEMAPDLHISRKFVFHSTTLVGAGIYLIFMAVVGLYVKDSSSEWGKLIQTTFFFAAFLLLVVLFFSPKVKARVKRYLSYSFRNKYDYRDEWNRFSQTLLIPVPDVSLQQRAVQAAGQIVDSQGGSLWTRESGHYNYKASWRHVAGQPQSISEKSRLIQFLLTQREPFEGSRLQGQLDDDDSIDPVSREIANSWLILPLWINEELYGFVNLLPPIVDFDLDIEDIDLLSTVAHHVSLALFLKEADTQLQQAQRFKDLNQMTAFLVHDLKTVFSQLSLLVENANTHKQNPEFVDDMISTVDHTTQKMQRLLQQLRNPEKEITLLKFPLIPVIEEIAASYQHLPTAVTLNYEFDQTPKVRADRQQLTSAIKHIVQNGVESVGKNGQVKIVAKRLDENVVELVIEDDGEGMTPEFINDGLFKPFETTKGVSGMGVGVYQSREYIRSITGEIEVSSKPGIGTRFKILIPVDYE
jgi:putative PEP-CTERM system histidine kinase